MNNIPWKQHENITSQIHLENTAKIQYTVKPLCTDAAVLGKIYHYIELSLHIGH